MKAIDGIRVPCTVVVTIKGIDDHGMAEVQTRIINPDTGKTDGGYTYKVKVGGSIEIKDLYTGVRLVFDPPE